MKKFHFCILFILLIAQASYGQSHINFEFTKLCIPENFDSCIKSYNNTKMKYVQYRQGDKLIKSGIYSWDSSINSWKKNPEQEFLYEFDKNGKLSNIKVMIAEPDSKKNSSGITVNIFTESYFYNSQNQLIKVLIEQRVKNDWQDCKQTLFEYENNKLSRIIYQNQMVTRIKKKKSIESVLDKGEMYGIRAYEYRFKIIPKEKAGWGTTEYITFSYLANGGISVNQFELDWKEYLYFLDNGLILFKYKNIRGARTASQVKLSNMGELLITYQEDYCSTFLKNNKIKNTIIIKANSDNYYSYPEYVYYYGYDF